MRAVDRALVVLLLLTSATLAGTPSSVAAAGPLVTDKEGDVVVTGGATSSPPLPANAQTASADLLALSVDEQITDFTFTIKVASFAQQGGSINRFNVSFTWMDATLVATEFRSRVDPTSKPLTMSELGVCDQSKCTHITDLEHTLDEAAGTFTFLVPKRYITSFQGHAPVFGSELTNVFVTSVVTFDGFPGAPATGTRAEDRMPDSGGGVITYQKGGSSNGNLVLEAPNPVRVSNGGATTFVFNSHVQNKGDADDTAIFTLDGVPAAWTVTAPNPQKVAAKTEKPVFLLATIPFGHEHGGFTNFTLVATSAKDGSKQAKLTFGVLHTPTPMPAGHHSEIFLHAAPGDSGVFQTAVPRTVVTMNTKEDHANDAPDALATTTPQGGEVSWRVPLSPQLQIGVDMDINRTGQLVANLAGHVDAQATFTGELWLVKGDTDLALMGKIADAKVALTQSAVTPVKSQFTPDLKSDYVPYAAGNDLELRFKLKFDGTAPPMNPQTPPSLPVKDFRLSLPLNEYADAATFEEGEGTTLKITAPDGLEKSGRPATTITYALTVTNLGKADDFALEIAGPNAKDTETAPSGSIRIENKESKTVTIAVHIPSSSDGGLRLDSLLAIRSKTDPSNLAIARIATTVAKGSAAADEQTKFEAAKNADKKTPLAPVVALAALALAVVARRRRS